jgi:cation diffusion facilitator CzcD-associated flavoprotein CzcO
MAQPVDIAIIGAGPYGLSIAAHLKARGAEFRIFGSPMHTWLNHMPQGMHLKSEGFASTLYDPDSKFTLADYCKQQVIQYADIGFPISLNTFTSYGLEFQRRLLPELEEKLVRTVARSSSGFEIGLENGEAVTARRVVVAAGLSHFQYVPPILASLPSDLVTHSSAHRTFERFAGKNVTVVGAGASAADVAAALLDAGARVRMVARKPFFRFHDPPGRIPRPWLERVRSPMTGLGPGWRSLFCTATPLVFRQMPERFRLEVVRKHLGPAAGWVVKDRVVGQAEFRLASHMARATVRAGRLQLRLESCDGTSETVETDHVIAATGYTADLRRLSFLESGVLRDIRSVQSTPVLSSNFECSVSGMYFVGNPSANTFGPLVRFAFGAGFTARRLSKHLAR